MRRVVRQALQRPYDHGPDPGILHGARGATARLVPQSLQPVDQETPAPFADCDRVDVEMRHNGLVGDPVPLQRNDLGTQRQSLSRLRPSRERLKLRALALAQDQ